MTAKKIEDKTPNRSYDSKGYDTSSGIEHDLAEKTIKTKPVEDNTITVKATHAGNLIAIYDKPNGSIVKSILDGDVIATSSLDGDWYETPEGYIHKNKIARV